jgi:Mg2+ and Co2+ transporter CorA
MFCFHPTVRPYTHSPLSTVASRLQAELPLETDTELKQHLADLVDHLHALRDQSSSMVRNCMRMTQIDTRQRPPPSNPIKSIHITPQVGWAKSLADEALNEQQYRMNQVIYLLTMITVVVLPAQFLTGVFGESHALGLKRQSSLSFPLS